MYVGFPMQHPSVSSANRILTAMPVIGEAMSVRSCHQTFMDIIQLSNEMVHRKLEMTKRFDALKTQKNHKETELHLLSADVFSLQWKAITCFDETQKNEIEKERDQLQKKCDQIKSAIESIIEETENLQKKELQFTKKRKEFFGNKLKERVQLANPNLIRYSLSFVAGTGLIAVGSGASLPLAIFAVYNGAGVLSTYRSKRLAEKVISELDRQQAKENRFFEQRANELVNNATTVEDDWEALGGAEGVMCLDSKPAYEEDFDFVTFDRKEKQPNT